MSTRELLMPYYTPSPPRPSTAYNYYLPGPRQEIRYLKTPSGAPGSVLENSTQTSNMMQVVGGRSAAIRTVGYFDKVSKGTFIAPLPYSGSRARYGMALGVCWADFGSVLVYYKGYNPYQGSALGQLDSFSSQQTYDPALPNRALIAARMDLKDQKVNLAQAFAERLQTARLLEETLGKVVRCVQAVRKGRFLDAVKALELPGSHSKKLSRSKTAAQNWLALQYGWKPLLSDLYGSAELLREKDVLQPARYRLSSCKSASSEGEFVPVVRGDFSGNFPSGTLVKAKATFKKKAFVRLDYALNPNSVLQLATKVGFTNPAQLAWEFTPFSFVADWFFPVGNWLSTFDATLGLTFLGGSLTERYEIQGEASCFKGGPGYPRIDCKSSSFSESFRRTVYTLEPFARPPGFKNPVSGFHLANALALIETLRRSTR